MNNNYTTNFINEIKYALSDKWHVEMFRMPHNDKYKINIGFSVEINTIEIEDTTRCLLSTLDHVEDTLLSAKFVLDKLSKKDSDLHAMKLIIDGLDKDVDRLSKYKNYYELAYNLQNGNKDMLNGQMAEQ